MFDLLLELGARLLELELLLDPLDPRLPELKLLLDPLDPLDPPLPFFLLGVLNLSSITIKR